MYLFTLDNIAKNTIYRMTREEYKSISKDYKGTLNGQRTVLTNINGSTQIVRVEFIDIAKSIKEMCNAGFINKAQADELKNSSDVESIDRTFLHIAHTPSFSTNQAHFSYTLTDGTKCSIINFDYDDKDTATALVITPKEIKEITRISISEIVKSGAILDINFTPVNI